MKVIRTFSTMEAGMIAQYLCETRGAFTVHYVASGEYGPRMEIPAEELPRVLEFCRGRLNPIRIDILS